jgi:hypothetical protein
MQELDSTSTNPADLNPQERASDKHTGLPDKLKASVEALSGYSLDDVKVHSNSAKPAQLQALAYAQGTEIHVAPGQALHLPHEAWHVVEQEQGVVPSAPSHVKSFSPLMTPSLIARRHKEVLKRSFDRHMDLFLTSQFLREKELKQVSVEGYATFSPGAGEWSAYLRSQQAKSYTDILEEGCSIKDLDEAIKGWWGENKEQLVAYREVHDSRVISLAGFAALYSAQALICPYCHVSLSEFEQLRVRGLLFTKRLRTRGTSFELDCSLPHLGYAEGNVVLCCYWCNNAKTDEFTPEEFAPVGEAMGRAWRGRLGKG